MLACERLCRPPAPRPSLRRRQPRPLRLHRQKEREKSPPPSELRPTERTRPPFSPSISSSSFSPQRFFYYAPFSFPPFFLVLPTTFSDFERPLFSFFFVPGRRDLFNDVRKEEEETRDESLKAVVEESPLSLLPSPPDSLRSSFLSLLLLLFSLPPPGGREGGRRATAVSTTPANQTD